MRTTNSTGFSSTALVADDDTAVLLDTDADVDADADEEGEEEEAPAAAAAEEAA